MLNAAVAPLLAVVRAGSRQGATLVMWALVEVLAAAATVVLAGATVWWARGRATRLPAPAVLSAGAVALVAGAVGLVVDGASLIAQPLSKGLDVALLRSVLHERSGVAIVARALGCAVAAILLDRWYPRSGREGRTVVPGRGASALLMAGVAVAVAGHVAMFTGGGGAKPAVVTLVGTELEVRAELTPARTGANELHLYVFDSDHRQVSVASMSVRMVRSGTSTPVEVDLVRAGPNHFLSASIDVDAAGVWIVHADVATNDDVTEQIDGSVDIGGS